ncbi:MAG: 30S ribosomal protein S6 [Bradymonadaceae bacterium]
MKDRQREYETVYILRPDLDDTEVSDIQDRLEEALDEAGGHLLTFDDWGTRSLAYEVRDEASGKKFDRGLYQYFRYLAPAEEAKVLEGELQYVEPTLKFLTVKLDDDLIPDERLAEPVFKEEGERLPYSE